MIGALLAEVLGVGKEALAARNARRVAQIEADTATYKARADAAAQSAAQSHMWEIQAMQGAATSWKDEWFTVLLSLPLILSFIPGGDIYVQRGFEVLDGTPQWYQWAVLAAISFAFGRRVLPKFRKGKE